MVDEQGRGRVSIDPFPSTADPAAYIPRRATEVALGDLIRSARDPEWSSALIGPPGIGKTLLLRVLETRLADELEVIHLPYAALAPEELCAWALREAEEPAAEDPVAAFRHHLRRLRARGAGLLVAVDDANVLPIATAELLGSLVYSAGGALRLVVAADEEPRFQATLEAIGQKVDVVALRMPMTAQETHDYVIRRLDHADCPSATRERFDAATIGNLHRISEGIPGRLHAAAAQITRALDSEENGTGRFEPERDPAPATSSQPPASRPLVGDLPEADLLDEAVLEENALLGIPPADREPDELEPLARDARERRPDNGSHPPGGRARRRTDVGAAERPPRAPVDSGAATREFEVRPPEPRLAAPPPRIWIIGGALFVGLLTVLVPLIRSQLPQAPSLAEPIEPPVRDPAAAQPAPRLPEPQPRSQPAESPAPNAAPVPIAADIGPFSVQVNATPWANITVDGIAFGETPIANIPLIKGPHTFRASMADGRVLERTVEIDQANRFIGFE